MIPTNLFLNLNLDVILLALPFLTILFCWIYLLANSFRSNYMLKATLDKKALVNDNNYNSENVFPYVSVIVPARNEHENIERCLISLMEQNYPNFEIIAVDDNSTDDTLIKMKKIQQKYKHHNHQKQKNYPTLKIIELKDKPIDWTGKTWASEQGYLESKNDILLFVDADTYFEKNCIHRAISYMLKEELDVLTGYPFTELRDFWSKITIPIWKLMSITFGKNASNVNNPKSKIAFLMGCFFIIKRNVFEKIGTFRIVRNAIQEDALLGIKIKQSGYKLRMIPMDNLVNALWTRDLSTLWHGIGRTLAPMILNQERKVIINFFTIFFMTALPFLILLASLLLTGFYHHHHQELFITDKNNNCNNYCGILILNLIIFIIVIFNTALESKKTFKISPLYALLCPIGSLLLIIAHLSCLVPLSLPISRNLSKKIIKWKERLYVYKRIGGSMT